jgi:hypothetical protein
VGAVEYNLATGSTKVSTPPTIRLLHDSIALYGLIDVPSDNGGSYTDSMGHVNYGSVTLTFANLANTTHPYTWVSLQSDYKQTATLGVVCQCSPHQAAITRTHARAASSLTSTNSSSAPHRIWEFSLQMSPGITSTPLTSNSTNLGFNAQVTDSAGNQISLVNSNDLAQLSFSVIPLPEMTGVAIVLSFTMLVSLLIIHRREKQCVS